MIERAMLRSFRTFYRLILSSILVFSPALLLPTLAASQTGAGATITFTLDFPSSQPEHYSIRLQSDGAGRYQSSGRLSSDSDSDSEGADNYSFDLDFVVAEPARQKIFELAAKAGYFQKDVDSHHKGLAFTGKKTLSYKDAERSGESSYNYSSIAAVQELTNLMQGLGSTLEFGRRLEYDHHYQKLALDEELKRMEEMARSHQLIEVAAIQPILDQIIGDPSVINVTRARAQRLLQGVGVR
jgi:hypothetical protein